MSTRTIRRVVGGTTQYDGAGVKLVRVIGQHDTQDLDPFLMLDAFDSDDPADYIKGFPWHPHRGIETVTYLIRGDIEHGDSLGNAGSILDGGCQWMTAGGGILHQEMPQPTERMLGVQLWLNLPRKDKMVPPKYRDIRAEMVPHVVADGASIGIIAGRYQGVPGAAEGDYVRMVFLDVELAPEAGWTLATEAELTLFVYVIAGAGQFEDAERGPLHGKQAALFHPGETLAVRASAEGTRFLLFAGAPLREPIAWGGPIVMNTPQELRQAFQELNDGTFIQKPA